VFAREHRQVRKQMKNKRLVIVNLEVQMEIPAKTTDEQLAAALPETLHEVLSSLVRRPDDVTVVKVKEPERTADEHGREAVEAFYQQVTQEQREFLGLK